MQKRYNLEMYSPNNKGDRKQPVVVFGCYGRGTKADIKNHKGLCVIVWSGSDSVRLHEDGSFVQFCKENAHRVFHIAHSHWIQTDLKHFGFDVIDRVVIPKDLSGFKFEAHVGESVYHYGTQQRTWYYGTDLMRKLAKQWNKWAHMPNIHMATQTTFKFRELYDIYKDSFIGVRLTEHDNMAMSVIEMALMGRPSIFNGNVPGAIAYSDMQYTEYTPLTRRQWVWQDEKTLLPIVSNMILEADRRPDPLLAQEALEFIHDDEKWLDTEFYG